MIPSLRCLFLLPNPAGFQLEIHRNLPLLQNRFLEVLASLLQLLQLLIFHCLFSGFCFYVPQCQCLAHSFLFSSHLANGFASSSSSFTICTPPLHAFGLLFFMQKSFASISTLDRTTDFFPVFLTANHTISKKCLPFLGGTTLFSESAVKNSLTHQLFTPSILPFALIFLCHIVHFILCCCLISSFSV